MGCGCGGSNRQQVPRRQAVRTEQPRPGVRSTTVNGDGTVWNGPERPAPEATPEPTPAAAPVEA